MGELIDKASLTHICISECRYRPKASMVFVKENMFTSKQMELLTINNETLSIDGKYYVCKSCKNTIKKNRIPPCNEKSYNFMIDKLPEKFLTEKMSLSKLESHLLKLIIPFIRIAYIPGYGQFKVKGPVITVEADVTETLNEKVLPRQQELIPVALKRKLSYKGTFMEEIVSKSKVQEYFNYFKEFNDLFKDQTLEMERIDTWIEELRSTQEHENHDDNIDPMQEKFDEGRTNIPMQTAYNMSDVEKFVGFENRNGENNCWINCVLRALSVMVEWMPNYSYQSQDAMINALINYLNDMTIINNRRTLDADSRDIHLEQNSEPLSVKQLFSTMIKNNDFNTNRQQDAGEGFLLILQALGAMESNFINPFRFCKFSWSQKKRCLNCSEFEHSAIIEDNIVQFYAPKTGHFDMNQFVTSRLQEEDVRNSRCGNCRQFGANYSTQFIETQKVMIIQLNFMDESLTKKKSKCIPLQNLDININGQTKKYELHYIIEHIGPNLHSGHYKSYFKKNNTWYCANDKIITRIETEDLPSQPSLYILM